MRSASLWEPSIFYSWRNRSLVAHETKTIPYYTYRVATLNSTSMRNIVFIDARESCDNTRTPTWRRDCKKNVREEGSPRWGFSRRGRKHNSRSYVSDRGLTLVTCVPRGLCITRPRFARWFAQRSQASRPSSSVSRYRTWSASICLRRTRARSNNHLPRAAPLT